MPTQPDVDTFQSSINDLSILALADVVSAWTHVQGEDPQVIRQTLMTAFPLLLRPYMTAAGQLAAHWYQELGTADYQAVPAEPANDAQLQSNVGWATNPLFTAKPSTGEPPRQEQSATERPDVVLNRLSGATKRHVNNVARDTITQNADTEGVKWVRVAQPDACAFCRLLATRGGAYLTAESASVVSGKRKQMSRSEQRAVAAGRSSASVQPTLGVARGSRPLGESYHDHCRCEVVPIRDGDSYEQPDYVAEWESQYLDAVKNTPGKGKYGAIDVKAVLAHMRENSDAR